MLKLIREFRELMHEVVMGETAKVPAKAVAQELDKPYFTLARELNPEDPGGKLDAALVLPIMQTTGDHRPLEFLAHAMGYRLSPVKAAPDRPSIEAECLDDYPSLVAFHQEISKGAPWAKAWARGEQAIREIEETMISYRRSRGGERAR